jgi:hypothetical protein
MSTKTLYSTFRRTADLNQAMLTLYLQQAPTLLKQIQESFTDPEIRVGLSIKILYNTPKDTRFPLEVIEPVIRDLETMIKDHDYLRSTGSARHRLRCLRNELNLVQRYIDLEETVTLNCNESELTFVDSQMDTISGSVVDDAEDKNDETTDDANECLIM